ncbi:hypothetical protein INR49_005544 [Caranx melampygus]|nr:hypothetical protein INR49_005544 [Caranx melampygus]
MLDIPGVNKELWDIIMFAVFDEEMRQRAVKLPLLRYFEVLEPPRASEHVPPGPPYSLRTFPSRPVPVTSSTVF